MITNKYLFFSLNNYPLTQQLNPYIQQVICKSIHICSLYIVFMGQGDPMIEKFSCTVSTGKGGGVSNPIVFSFFFYPKKFSDPHLKIHNFSNFKCGSLIKKKISKILSSGTGYLLRFGSGSGFFLRLVAVFKLTG